MKRLIIASIIILCWGSFDFFGQQSKDKKSELKDIVSALSIDKDAKINLLKEFNGLDSTTKKAILDSSKENINKRMDKYFSLKELKTSGLPVVHENKDLVDFRWEFVANDMDLILIGLDIKDFATIEKVETGNSQIPYKIDKFPENKFFVVPILNNDSSIYVKTETGKEMKLTITEIPVSKEVCFVGGYSEGCEITIITEPHGAEVYFNDRKYHKLTNIHSSRKAEKLSITIKKEGYKTWGKTKALSVGEKWKINIKLVQEKN